MSEPNSLNLEDRVIEAVQAIDALADLLAESPEVPVGETHAVSELNRVISMLGDCRRPVQGPPEEIGTGLYRMADGDLAGGEPEQLGPNP